MAGHDVVPAAGVPAMTGPPHIGRRAAAATRWRPLDASRLRLLLVHNRYRSAQPSGENVMLEADARLLAEHGCVVDRLELRSDDIADWPLWKRATLPGRVVWSRAGQAAVGRAIARFRPTVIHIHNTFPLFSPAVLRTSRASGLAVVQTLHNFRPLCPAATFLRAGRPCEDCLGRLPLPAVVHACYRGSRAATLPVALMGGLHERIGTWHSCVDRFVVPSAFARAKYVQAGWPDDRLCVRHNTLRREQIPQGQRSDRFVCLSRLSPEKGVDVLLEAWVRAFPEGGARLDIIGGGPSEHLLRSRFGHAPGVRFLGQVDRSEALEHLARARAVVVPSRCYELFPMVVVEAYAAGVPVVASRIGSLAELIDDGVTGLHVAVGDPDDLAGALRRLATSPELAGRLGEGAHACFEGRYGPEAAMARLFEIYAEAIESCRLRRSSRAS